MADECPANPVARIFKETANDSPSPWGEGRDEGGREPFEIRMPQGQLVAPKSDEGGRVAWLGARGWAMTEI